jgi:hypothetical protein
VPGEAANVWAAPTGLRTQPPTHRPSPPKPASRVGLVIASVLGVLLLGMMSFVFYWFSKDGGLKVKVLTDTVDKAACGSDPKLALAYPEIKTTYCFSPA